MVAMSYNSDIGDSWEWGRSQLSGKVFVAGNPHRRELRGLFHDPLSDLFDDPLKIMNARRRTGISGGAGLALIIGILSAGILSAAPPNTCKCLATYPVCTEVSQTNLIFIGTVESIEPAFLDPWNASRLSLIPVDEIMRLRAEGSASSLARLKAIYLKLYPNMPEYYRKGLEDAQTHNELKKIFDSLSGEGRQARIRVKAVFRHKDDDDDDDKGARDADKKDDDKAGNKKDDNDDDDKVVKDKKDVIAVKKAADKKDDDHDDDDDDKLVGTVVTVWTDAGDCGYDFQTGETYLVYADDDEETGQLATSICRRTTRLSDAGPDLAYLYYYKNGGDASTRLEGFVTTEPAAKLQVDRDRYAASVDSPVPDAVIQLKVDPDRTQAETPRYARADSGGKFIFDGLGAGDYELTVFDDRYPRTVLQLGFSKHFHAAAKSCASELLSVPKN
jgi:hypothetical protein